MGGGRAGPQDDPFPGAIVTGGDRSDRAPLPLWGAVLFAIAGILITLIWTVAARTEMFRNRGNAYAYSSIVGLAKGETPAPFVYRRLFPDATNLLASALPSAFWDRVTQCIMGTPWMRRITVGHFLWPDVRDYPILISGTLILWLSMTGFMVVVRRILLHEYDVSPRASIWLGVLLGFLFLGAYGGRYQWYPYDFVTLLVFSAAVLALISRSVWFVPVFLVAAYAKETAVILLVGYLILENRARLSRKLVLVALLGAAYVGLQVWNRSRFPDAVAETFWFPGRNADYLARYLAFGSWTWVFVLVAAAQMVAMRARWPADLRRLLWLLPILVVPAFFKGWIEERRQYLELYSVAGPLVLQWLASVTGRGLLPRKRAA